MKRLVVRLIAAVFVVLIEAGVCSIFGLVESFSYWFTIYALCIPLTYIIDGIVYIFRRLGKIFDDPEA